MRSMVFGIINGKRVHPAMYLRFRSVITVARDQRHMKRNTLPSFMQDKSCNLQMQGRDQRRSNEICPLIPAKSLCAHKSIASQGRQRTVNVNRKLQATNH